MYERELNDNEQKMRKIMGQNIRRAREESAFSLREAARELKYPQSNLSDIENGKKVANGLLLGKMAQLYGISVDYFYSGKECGAGEEKYIEAMRIARPLQQQLWGHFVLTFNQLCSTMFPCEDSVNALLRETKELIRQSHRMIAQNHQEAWQDMKGGNAFCQRLEKAERALRFCEEARHLHQRALNTQRQNTEQMDLFK